MFLSFLFCNREPECVYSDLHFPTWLHNILCIEIAERFEADQIVTIRDVNDANQPLVSYNDLNTIINASMPSTVCHGYHMKMNNVFTFIRKYVMQELLYKHSVIFKDYYNGLLSKNPITQNLSRLSCKAWSVCEAQYRADFRGLKQPQCTLTRAWRDPFWEHDWECFLGNGCQSRPGAFHCMRTTKIRYFYKNVDDCKAV